MVFDLSRQITKEGGYLDKGVPYIRRVQDKSFSQNLNEMTSNIRIMGIAADILWHNGHHRIALEQTAETLRTAIVPIEAYFVENDVQFVAFDPEATWN